MSSGKTLIDHASNPVKSKLINGSTGSATGYGDLEDYIMELQSRSLQNGSSENDKNGINIGNSVNSVINGETNVDPTELLLQLAQKEKDLILAAELGKALLERNEQLTRANERITEEYSHKLEQIDAMFKQREVTSFSKILFVLMNVHLQPVV
uniref:HAP1 N-terminal domain-containing protein n=1 Tax=Tetranychus urticae TaxID=32264 RepID=T1L066_TETUR